MITIKEHFNKYHRFLSKLPLFKGILEDDLTNFFRSMQVKQFHKGEMVTFNMDEHSKLYIVYEGLFKLTKIDEKGDEIVLSILDQGGVVSPMHFSPYYDVCAEFIKNTTMFYFTEKAVNDFSTKNHQFSINTIKFLADSVQTLMISAEVLQLKTAKEKVGWYLVHAKINNTFKLPYSKSLIASYLGMKPESFSRALTELKKDGVTLKNKKIVLENGDELCKYCDKVSGSNCAFFQTELCIHD
ncbi:MAG: Crp/Fnr family transcriptional regulator [Candidatus Thioglobus sp.]|jgi:CRP-like cAMP-binding protein|uniref:Crp/Fnr family transcriptional regulator n=1 Tax=Candidatus Thioglobus sp. TaxID=2026721 RepID=UPI001DB29B7F|nr:Crp/Fnr family transcriptional regulator [Candidatus Thioglobus sp.]MBT3186583.1 Crp/Fnr family transcriptional regulator [Candidatus Thioglobus sp.]MBT3965233.1 Crp/Fnr family transcriptional regulator [Candidatus Thioglobus sp.]MBT5287002.1 Crp/Fnr family transcriptional regulator [Candidatus Thioglobus sp.]MBT5784251.1 Crp/Fnr family transcriptional regulator [Candidatus Thioglobus sp.]MBT6655482.1 Crp/Fnr family transcriptional regulator [Candidatus Thioglobus sp.]